MEWYQNVIDGFILQRLGLFFFTKALIFSKEKILLKKKKKAIRLSVGEKMALQKQSDRSWLSKRSIQLVLNTFLSKLYQ